jgi:hypothetical protein
MTVGYPEMLRSAIIASPRSVGSIAAFEKRLTLRIGKAITLIAFSKAKR